MDLVVTTPNGEPLRRRVRLPPAPGSPETDFVRRNYRISVSEQHISELENGSFEQAPPARDRHAVLSDAIGMAIA